MTDSRRNLKKKVLLIGRLQIMLIALLTIVVFSFGCGGSEESNKGTLQFINNSNNPYSVDINSGDDTFIMDGKSSREITKEAGFYKVDVKQLSGYILYPTEKSYTGTLKKSDKLIFSFP